MCYRLMGLFTIRSSVRFRCVSACSVAALIIVCAGIDVDKARKEEERIMLQDATAVLAGGGTLTPHPNTKATALHVASAKGYIEVLK